MVATGEKRAFKVGDMVRVKWLSPSNVAEEDARVALRGGRLIEALELFDDGEYRAVVRFDDGIPVCRFLFHYLALVSAAGEWPPPGAEVWRARVANTWAGTRGEGVHVCEGELLVRASDGTDRLLMRNSGGSIIPFGGTPGEKWFGEWFERVESANAPWGALSAVASTTALRCARIAARRPEDEVERACAARPDLDPAVVLFLMVRAEDTGGSMTALDSSRFVADDLIRPERHPVCAAAAAIAQSRLALPRLLGRPCNRSTSRPPTQAEAERWARDAYARENARRP